MEAEQTNDTAQREDIIQELTKLDAAGYSENQIAHFARLRGTYNQTNDNIGPGAKVMLTAAEKNHLAFVRWLYMAGRLES